MVLDVVTKILRGVRLLGVRRWFYHQEVCRLDLNIHRNHYFFGRSLCYKGKLIGTLNKHQVEIVRNLGTKNCSLLLPVGAGKAESFSQERQ